MNRDVQTIDAERTVTEARTTFRTRNIRHLVVRSGDEIVGILSERDIGSRPVIDESEESVRNFMTAHPVVVDPNLTIRQAANRMRGRSIGCLPVVDDGELVGIITTSDLLTLIGKGAASVPPGTERWILKHRGNRKPKAPPI